MSIQLSISDMQKALLDLPILRFGSKRVGPVEAIFDDLLSLRFTVEFPPSGFLCEVGELSEEQ